MLIYLDWNVIDRIEKIEKLNDDEKRLYSNLRKFLSIEDVFVPYSNAHLRDLLRGYTKNPEYIDGHLDIIQKLTGNLCLCQYWKKDKVTWHFRSVYDFFEELKEEKADVTENFGDLLSWDNSGLWEAQKLLLRMIPVPKEFKSIYTQDALFNIIYPTTKKEMNLYALCSDLYNFSRLVSTDYALYKTLKKFIIQTMNKLRNNPQILKTLKSLKIEPPKYLEIDNILDEFSKNQKIQTDNLYYHKIIDTFFRFDLKGYKSDGQFPNMIDDSLHTFYAAHCDYLITNDDKCKYKATKTYERLKIKTIVCTANEFIEFI